MTSLPRSCVTLTSILLLLGALSSPGRAQTEQLRRGDLVRLSSSMITNPSITARVSGVRQDTLLLALEASGTPLALPRSTLTMLERRVPNPRRGRRVLVGSVAAGAVGGVLGVGVARAIHGLGSCYEPCPYSSSTDVKAFLLGAAVSFPLGGAVGLAVSPGSWQRIWPPD